MLKAIPIAAIILVGIFFGATGSASFAADAGPARIAELIAPVIDDQTLLVGHIDLEKLDVPAAIEAMGKIVPLDKADRIAIATERDDWVKRVAALKKAGARDLILVSSIADYPRGAFFLAVPLAAGVDVEALMRLDLLDTRADAAGARASRHGDVLVWADPPIKDRLAALTPTARPEIATALESVAGSGAQLVFVPPADARRVVEEMLPNLPAEFGGAASRIFTQGVVWAAAGMDLPPRPLRMRLVAQSLSADAAAALNTELPKLWEAFGKLPAVVEAMPQFAEVARTLQLKVVGDRLTLELSAEAGLGNLQALLAPPLETARMGARRSQSSNSLKQIMLAFHNYLGRNNTFPARAIYSPDGKPLLSWRVALLPWLGEQKLYQEFKLDEPWDSEHNRQLIKRMPAVLRSSRSGAAAGTTTYLVPIMPGGIFGGEAPMSLKEIKDGTSNTIMVVEADDDHAVEWTRPDDLQIDPEQPSEGLDSYGRDGFLTAFADGSVRVIEPNRPAADWRAMITAAGGEVIPQ